VRLAEEEHTPSFELIHPEVERVCLVAPGASDATRDGGKLTMARVRHNFKAIVF